MLEWDETKRQTNLEKHGLDSATFEGFGWDRAVFLPVDTLGGEQRERVVGFPGYRLVTAVFTERDEALRVISLRPASPAEERTWHDRQP